MQMRNSSKESSRHVMRIWNMVRK